MINILFEYPQLNCGGTEVVMYNLAKFFDSSQYHVDILVRKQGNNEEIFRKIGCSIYLIPFTSKEQYKLDLMTFFNSYHYDVVHTHMHSDMGLVMECASKAGILVRVAHSHNARLDIPHLFWPVQIFRNWCVENYANLFFACSRIAAKWMFPRHRNSVYVIYNAIDLDDFKFDVAVRKQKRKELGITDKTKVIINVGRCTDQKNHSFILDRAKELKNEDILFVIIGDGPLFKSLSKRIEDEYISNVHMMGKRFDVSQWLCAADVFIFPSIYEGLGIVAIEAQACGLRVLSTNTIPIEADMQMGSFERVALADIRRWNDLLKQDIYSEDKRLELSCKAFDSHYNIRVVAKEVEQLYKSKLC
ncbi:glycosyltransferase [Parabacteroides faecis]|uniref:glycosyltransferase n=1 Tax=Parabacteroides faecis TaxID=1217282 RepID=UPI003521F15A